MISGQHLKRILNYIIKGIPVKNVTANITYSASHQLLLGKSIIVTGGGRGIGASMAKRFIDEGAEVLITGRNENILRDLSKKIKCKYLTLDLQKTETFSQFILEAEKELGKLDILVNNAGISLHESSLFNVTEDTFDKQISTNLKGPFFLSQNFIKYLTEKNRKGNILFISSETGDTVDFRPYGFTKASINSMVKGFAYLLNEKNIRVNAIAPGITASDMTGFNKDGNLYCNYTISKRVYLPEEMAEVATFLLSDISGCISGEIITCNNGNTINARWR